MTRDKFIAALREAFDAGREQGSEEATAYECGAFPMQKPDAAFADLLAEWNKGPILDCLAEMH